MSNTKQKFYGIMNNAELWEGIYRSKEDAMERVQTMCYDWRQDAFSGMYIVEINPCACVKQPPQEIIWEDC